MEHNIQIAVDGPAGAGKSTVAKEVAKRLNLLYIDTGAIYRTVTLVALRHNIDLKDEKSVADLANNLEMEMIPDSENLYRIVAAGRDVTLEIRHPEVSRHVSSVAKIPAVREGLLEKQRRFARNCGVVMEGRDIGTTVLPHAQFKFFLTASPAVRAQRRYEELKNAGYRVDFDSLLQELEIRDRIDSNREKAPLIPAEDAEIIDCSELEVGQVVDHIVSRVTGR